MSRPISAAPTVPLKRLVALVTVLGLALLPACSSDDGGDAEDGPAAEAAAAAEDLSEEEQEIVDTAQAWIDDEADLEDDQRESLRFTSLMSSPAVTNVTFGQFIDDHPVRGSELVVHVLEDGTVQGANNALLGAEPGDDVDPIDEALAEENAGKAVDGTPEEVGPAELVWVPSGTELVLAWSVTVTTSDPTGSWIVVLDAESGEVIDVSEAAASRSVHVARAPWSAKRTPATILPASARLQDDGDACDPGPAPSACLFLPDPIFAAGGERPDADEANSVLEGQPLEGLDDPESGHLIGEFVDTEPSDATVEPPVETDGTWAAGRARPGIEHAMTYYWIDRAHRELDRLGFGDVWDRPIPVEAVDTDIEDNAQWDGTTIRMGVGSDGINEGEDASGITHEYGHAVLGEMAPVLYESAEGGAYHEGFGDMLAYFVTLEERTGDQACFFAWTDQMCLRRMDTDLVYPDDVVNEVHDDGMIYTGAIWDIFEALLAEDGIDIEDCPGSDECGEVRDRVLTTLLTSHGYLVEGTTLPDIAAAYESANEAAFDGEDAELINEAFAAHGLTGGGGTTMDPAGEIDEPEEGITAVEVRIAHTFRGDLEVEVGVLDSSGEALCEPVNLLRPDNNDGEDNVTALVDLTGTDCSELAPPSEDQQWYLRATDTLAEDTGEILSFAVYDGEDPYPAPGLPQPIADNDPEGTTVIVDGSGVDPSEPEMPDTSEGDGPSADLEITHTYTGDLSIRAGVADADGEALCSVEVLEPQPGEAGDGGLSGTVDLSDCEDFYPPSADTLWFVAVTDTAAVDTGTVDALTLNGPDGEAIEFDDLPAEIPDDDEDGLVLFTDGDFAGTTSGGTSGDGPEVEVVIDHPYSGDLSVEVGAVDRNDEVVCQVRLATPDPANNAPGLEIQEALDDCAGDFPPEAGVRFYVMVIDTLERDTGQFLEATITGPDGDVLVAQGPGEIPDADPEGIIAFFQPA